MTKTLSLTFLKILGRINYASLFLFIHALVLSQLWLLTLLFLVFFKGVDISSEVTKRTLPSRLIGPQIGGVSNSPSCLLAVQSLAVLLLGVIAARSEYLGFFLLPGGIFVQRRPIAIDT